MKLIPIIVLFQYIFSAIINIPLDYPTIQEGINNANANDTLQIERGLYEETLIISDANLTLQSNYFLNYNNEDITETTISSQAESTISIYNSNINIIGISIAANLNGISLENSSLELHKTIIFNAYDQGYAINVKNNSSLYSAQCTMYGFNYTLNSDINSSFVIDSSILWPYYQIIYSSPLISSIDYSCIKDDNYNINMDNNITLNPFIPFNLNLLMPSSEPYNSNAGDHLSYHFINEYPWIGNPSAQYDRCDNNPWVENLSDNLLYSPTNDGRVVRIGDGEPFAEDDPNYDPDGDGVSGEDWLNGFDDDGDGLIDEDYFFADGIDNDGNCEGDTNFDGCVCCGWHDINGNGEWDAWESHNNGDENVDERIDTPNDTWFDGVDNDQNGTIDDNQEMYTGGQVFPNWGWNIQNEDVIIFNGRKEQYLGSEPYDDYGIDGIYAQGSPTSEPYTELGTNNVYDEGIDILDDCGMDGLCPGDEDYWLADFGEGDGIWNPAVDEGEFNGTWDEGEFYLDINGDGSWTPGTINPWYIENNFENDNQDLRGKMFYDQNIDSLFFDVYIYDFGDDQIPGDSSFIDDEGNGDFDAWEGGNTMLTGPLGNPTPTNIPSEPCLEGFFGGNDQCGDPTDTFNPAIHDLGLDGIAGTNDYGEGNGAWDTFDWNENGQWDDGDIWDPGLWIDTNNNGIPDNSEIDLNENGIADNNEPWIDNFPYGNEEWDAGEQILDCGQDGLCPGDIGYIEADYGEGDGIFIYIDSNESELDKVFDTGDGCFGCNGDYIPTWINFSSNITNVSTSNYPSYYLFKSEKHCGEGIFNQDHLDNNFNSNDFGDLNNNNQPDIGEPGVNDFGMIYKDGIDNDGDGTDIDGDGYPYFQEIRFGTDPENINSYPVNTDGNPMAVFDWEWAIDELIDEQYCTDYINPEEYQGLVPSDDWISLNKVYGSNIFHISPISPALDAGNPNFSLDPNGTIVDMGALSSSYPYYGCTDPNAYNYNLFSVIDDGSCFDMSCSSCSSNPHYDSWGNSARSVIIGANGLPICSPCREVIDGIDNDEDWSSSIPFPLFLNNTPNGVEVYSNGFAVDFENPIYNTVADGYEYQGPAFDWSQEEGFDWANEGEGAIPGQWGYVDYIRCADSWHPWAGGEVACSSFTHYTGRPAVAGDTIGVTIYEPEDVVYYQAGGSLSYQNHAQEAQYWDPVGIDEYSPISGSSYFPIIPDFEFSEFINSETFNDENENGQYDEYYYDEELEIVLSEDFEDINGNDTYDTGGWTMQLSWDSPIIFPMIEIEDSLHFIGNTPWNTSYQLWSNQIAPITVDSTAYLLSNIPENTLVCNLVQLNSNIDIFSNYNAGCVMSPENPLDSDLGMNLSIPKEYQLLSNYPNPFNPITNIKYAIPEHTFLRITIFDIRGRKVQELYKGFQNMGYHEIQWNASHYASGIYFLRMQTDNFVKTQKMTLIK